LTDQNASSGLPRSIRKRGVVLPLFLAIRFFALRQADEGEYVGDLRDNQVKEYWKQEKLFTIYRDPVYSKQ